MASRSLVNWQTVRMPALAAVEAQCLATAAGMPLAEENVRGYVLLLTAHFQGFCRDLYTDCVQAVVLASPAGLRLLVQTQCEAQRHLEARNPSLETISGDFNRFGVDLSAALQLVSANQPRITHLSLLNRWRNFAAHANSVPPAGAGTLTPIAVGAWRQSCDGLAAGIEQVMYNVLVTATGAAPW